MPLSTAQTTTLGNADPVAIALEFQKIAKNWKSGRWLQSRNRYKTDAVAKLKQDKKSNVPVSSRELRQYIAASAVMHGIDGWSYFSRAIDALLRGDSGAACHLGYYAELRAAMSLLSAEGVGVFDLSHFVVDSGQACLQIPELPRAGTHSFVWDALRNWGSQQGAASLLFEIIQPGGIPLRDWLSAFSMGPGFTAVLAKHWLEQWGLDLMRLSDDRAARNVASYRPNELSYARPPDAKRAIKFGIDLWNACEPKNNARFANIDAWLLRLAIDVYFRQTHAAHLSGKQAKSLYRQMVGAMLHQLHPLVAPPTPFVDWQDFLTKGLGNKPIFFDAAAGKARHTDSRHPQQVVSRAILLLRVSSGAGLRLCKQKVDFSDAMKFWWLKFGASKRFWGVNDVTTSPLDLWSDVEIAISMLEPLLASQGADGFAYDKLTAEQATSVSTLGTYDRVGMWGLGI